MGNTNMIPNISSSGYPFVDNVNTWASQSTFNYALWAANSKLTLTRVPWDTNYKNVVKFATSTARDTYFTSLASKSSIINQAVRIPKDGEVMLPFNYDEVITFNYLIVEYPLPGGYTPKQNTIKTKYYYFVQDMEYKNANVTRAVITLDYWTTFIDDVEIGESMLHRGHAPMGLKTVEAYLANPIANTNGLLTPDINFGEANNVTHEHFIPFQSGNQYVLIATTANITGTWTDNTTIKETHVEDGLPTNIYVFATLASNYASLISYINSNIPQFLQTVQAIFVLDESFITLGTAFTVGSITCYSVTQKETSLYNITLQKSMFNIPSEYDWMVKLYTSPYSVLEVTDNKGNTVEIAVEETSSTLGVRSVSSLAYPYIDVKAFITGVGGTGSNSYTIKKFDTASTKTIYKDNWQEYSFMMDIPVYGIFQKNSINYNWSTKFDRIQAQNDIDTSYSNGSASALTSYNNAAASAQTGYDNTDASATTSSNVSKKANDNAIVKNNRVIATNDELCLLNNNKMAERENDNLVFNSWNFSGVQDGNRIAQNHNNAQAYLNAAVSTISGGIGAVTGSAMSGNGMPILGFVNHAMATQTTLPLAIGNSNDLLFDMWGGDASRPSVLPSNWVDMPSDYTGYDPDHPVYDVGSNGILSINNMIHMRKQGIISRHINATTNEKNNTLSSNNAATDYETAEYARTQSLNTAQTNNTRSKATADANNTRSKATADANNARSKSNSEAAIINHINQAALGNNVAYSKYEGSGVNRAEGIYGLDIKVKTQNPDILRRTGTEFARYGYMYDGIWNPTSLTLMSNFTYWEFSDIWITSDKVFENALEILRTIFTSGVTVWSDATKIGKVHIKDNVIPT